MIRPAHYRLICETVLAELQGIAHKLVKSGGRSEETQRLEAQKEPQDAQIATDPACEEACVTLELAQAVVQLAKQDKDAVCNS